MRDNLERLRHITEAIDRIEKYTASGPESFWANELIQGWVVQHLQVIGEAARATTPEFREQNPEIPWKDIIGMRHVIVHDYFGIDLDIVWRAVTDNLPNLKRQIATILNQPNCKP
jgi:uncharacterized protein with HEPN domain